MKNLFLAIALTGFIGAISVKSVAACTGTTIICCDGDEKTKKSKKECNKEAKCCSKDAANATAADKKACSEGKTCSKGTSCCHAKSTTTSETKTETKTISETKIENK